MSRSLAPPRPPLSSRPDLGETILLQSRLECLIVRAVLVGTLSGQLQPDDSGVDDASLAVFEFQLVPTQLRQRLKSCILSVRFAPAQPGDQSPSVIGLAPQGCLRPFHALGAHTACGQRDGQVLQRVATSAARDESQAGVLLRGAAQMSITDPTIDNGALWYIREDGASRGGLFFSLRCAILVAHHGLPYTVQAYIKTSMSPAYNVASFFRISRPHSHSHRPVTVNPTSLPSHRLLQLLIKASLRPEELLRLVEEPSLLNRLASFRQEPGALSVTKTFVKPFSSDAQANVEEGLPAIYKLGDGEAVAVPVQHSSNSRVEPFSGGAGEDEDEDDVILPEQDVQPSPEGTPHPSVGTSVGNVLAPEQRYPVSSTFTVPLATPQMKTSEVLPVAEILQANDETGAGPAERMQDSLLLDNDSDTLVWKEGSTRDKILRDFARGRYGNSYKLKRFKTLRLFNLYLYQHRLVKMDEHLQNKIDTHESLTDGDSDSLGHLLTQYDDAIKSFLSLDDYEDVSVHTAEVANNAISAKLGEPHYAADLDASMIDLNGGPDRWRRWIQHQLNKIKSTRTDRELDSEWNQSRYVGTAPTKSRPGLYFRQLARSTLLSVPVETTESDQIGVSMAAQQLASFSVALVGGVFLLAPLCQLAYTPQLKYQIISVALWILLFSCSVAASNRTGNVELLGATAAYAAVLVVFVGKGS